MNEPLAIELDEHAGALRALARLLVGEAHADDLVQDVALQTLRQPPPVQTGMRAFLQTMLRRRASNLRRAEQRRRRREEAAVQTAVEMSPASLVEHQEVVRLVTDQLLALPSPYRDVLFRRFFHDATPQQIAAAAGLPVATVKSQLQRGLAMLRQRLEGERGAGWRPLLVSAFGLAPERLVPPVGGIVVAGLAAKLLLVLGAAVLAFLVSLPFLSARPPGAPAGVPAVVAAATALTAPDAPRDEAASARSAVAAAASVAAGDARLHGRVVDERGTPLAGVQVGLAARAGAEAVMRWRRANGELALGDHATTTGADGAFSFEVATAPPVRFVITVSGAGRLPLEGGDWQLDAGTTRDVGDLVMVRGVVVEALVLDRSGRPQTECEVTLDDEQTPRAVAPDTLARDRTGVDGRVAFRSPLPPGNYRVTVAGRRHPQPAVVAVPADVANVAFTCVVDDVVAPMAIAGSVVDELGAPVPRVFVAVVGSSSSGFTDDLGHFVLWRPEQVRDEVDLRVEVRGFEALEAIGPVSWGRRDVRLMLHRALDAEVRVVAADSGAPVDDLWIGFTHGTTVRGMARYEDRHGRFVDGIVPLPGLPRGDWWCMVIPRDPRLEPRRVRLVFSDAEPRATITLVPALQPTVCDTDVRVRVQWADGTPVVGTKVLLQERVTRSEPVPPRDHFDIAQATTDRDGCVQLRGPRGVPVRIVATATWHLGADVELPQLAGTEPVVVTVMRGAQVSGQVTPRNFAARYRHEASPYCGPRLVPRLVLAQDPGAGAWTQHRVDITDDGRFAVGCVGPGPWRLELEWWGEDATGTSVVSGPQLLAFTLTEGDAPVLDLDVRRFAASELDTVVSWNGAPLRDTELELIRIDRRDGTEVGTDVRTDAEGRLRGIVFPGRLLLEWSSIDPPFLVRSDASVEAVVGDIVRTPFTLRTGRLQLRLTQPDGSPARGVQTFLWDPQGAVRLTTTNPTDEHGVVEWTVAPGDYHVQLGELGERGRTIGQVTVTAAAVVTAELKVAADAR